MSEKDKEQNLEKIRYMMMDSALQQAVNDNEEIKSNGDNGSEDNKNSEFFDF